MNKSVEDFLTFGMTKEQIKGGFLMLYRAAFMGFFLWAIGALALFRLGDGFAYASDTKVTAENVLAGRKDFLQARAFDLQVAKCLSPTPAVFTVQLRQVQEDYKDLTGEYIQLPSCDELKQ
jgi:hypothetical protein